MSVVLCNRLGGAPWQRPIRATLVDMGFVGTFDEREQCSLWYLDGEAFFVLSPAMAAPITRWKHDCAELYRRGFYPLEPDFDLASEVPGGITMTNPLALHAP